MYSQYIYPSQSTTGIHPGYSSTGIYPDPYTRQYIYPGPSTTGIRPDPFAASPQVNLPVPVRPLLRRRFTSKQRARRQALRAAKVPRKLWPKGLGDAESDAIVKSILDSARQLFPERTAEAEAWINDQLKTYGVSYAKYQAGKVWEPVGEFFSTPLGIVMLFGGLFWFFRR